MPSAEAIVDCGPVRRAYSAEAAASTLRSGSAAAAEDGSAAKAGSGAAAKVDCGLGGKEDPGPWRGRAARRLPFGRKCLLNQTQW